MPHQLDRRRPYPRAASNSKLTVEDDRSVAQASLDLPLSEPPSRPIISNRYKLNNSELWRFLLMNPELSLSVCQALRKEAERPNQAIMFYLLLLTLIGDNNEVTARRPELAFRMGVTPREITRLVQELKRLNVLVARPEGRSTRYYFHPRLATHMNRVDRTKAQQAFPPLQLPAPQLQMDMFEEAAA